MRNLRLDQGVHSIEAALNSQAELMEREFHMMSDEALSIAVHQSEVMVEVLGDILNLGYDNAILPPKGGGLILESDKSSCRLLNQVRCRSILD